MRRRDPVGTNHSCTLRSRFGLNAVAGGVAMEGDWDRARERLQGMRRRRRRRRSHRTGVGAGLAWRTSTMAPDLGSGHNYPNEQQNGSTTDSNSTSSSIYPSKENSIPKEAIIRHSSSSVIAKLVSLDEFPSHRFDPKQLKPTERWHQNLSSGVFHDKDTLEVVKESEAQENNLPDLSSCDSDLTFSSRNIIDEEDFFSCDQFEGSRENNEVIKYENSYEECSVKFQQQPGSKFRKNLQDLKWLELSHHSRRTINVKSFNGIKQEKNKLFYRFEGQTGSPILNNTKGPDKKLVTDHVLHSFKDQGASLSHTFAKLWRPNKNDTTTQPSKIVLLKPSLEKIDIMRRTSFPASIENISLHKRRQTIHSTFTDAKQRNKENMPIFKMIDGKKSKGSRGIAREITNYMRQSFCNNYFRDYTCVFGRYNVHNHDTSQNSLGVPCAWKRSYNFSASLTEFMRRGTRNEKMCYQSKQTVHHGSCTRTLGEMFALSDNEEPRRKLKFPTAIRSSDHRSSPEAKIPITSHSPSSFSNLDIHKDWYLIKMPKSSSLSGFAKNYGSSRPVQDVGNDHLYIDEDVPSLGFRDFLHSNHGHGGSLPKVNHRTGSNKSHLFRYVGKEEKWPPQQIFTQTEELEKESCIRSPEFDVFNFSDDNMTNSGNELSVSNSKLSNMLVEKRMDISIRQEIKI